jgi:hypothetical protein
MNGNVPCNQPSENTANQPNESEKVQGLSLAEWEAMYRPGIVEFAASNFAFSGENESQVRIAFCNLGPIINLQGTRSPVYTHAVTLPQSAAVALARVLLEHYAKPADDPKAPVAPV